MTLKLIKNRSLIVAEIGWNFLGKINLAKKMILAAKRNGADAVKFQIWDPKNLKRGPWDNDGRKELYQKSFLDKKRFKLLYNFSKKNKIKCFASVWSLNDLKTLASISKDIVKIPSPEAYDIKLITSSLRLFKQVIVSVGCLKNSELRRLYKFKNNDKLIILHCVSSYPLKAENCNFNKFHHLKKNFKKVGYSGHLDGIEDSVYAIANQAVLIEKHFTTSKQLRGKDNKFSLKPSDLKKLSDFRNLFSKFKINRGLNIQKDEIDVYKNYRGRWHK